MDACVGSGAVDAITENRGNPAEYQLTLRLSVEDIAALWRAAAERCIAGSDLTPDDVGETIGPVEDPSIEECLTMIMLGRDLAGCRMLDFSLKAVDDGAMPAGIGARVCENDAEPAPLKRRLKPPRSYGRKRSMKDALAAGVV